MAGKSGRVKRRLQNLTVTIGVCLLYSNSAIGKSPLQFWPELESPEFWNKNVIALAEIAGASGGDHIPMKVIQRFSGPDSWRDPSTISLHDAFFMPANNKPTLKVGDHLLTIQPLLTAPQQSGSDSFPVFKFDDKRTEDEMSAACKIISQVRSLQDPSQKLARAVESANTTGEMFTLNELSPAAEKTLPTAITDQLASIRKDAKTDIRVRILASQILAVNAKSMHQVGDDWNWLAAELKTEKFEKEFPFEFLIDRLTGYPDQYEQLVDLLCELGNNADRPASLKVAILTFGSDMNLWDGNKPDNPRNVKLFNMFIARLQDSSVSVRPIAAAGIFQAISHLNENGANAEFVREVAKRAANAITDSAARETDDTAKRYEMAVAELIRGIKIRDSTQ